MSYDYMREIPDIEDVIGKEYLLKSERPELSQQVIHGLARGMLMEFSPEQLAVYTSFEFHQGKQIDEIESGFLEGLSVEQVKIYADSKYNGAQMCQIRQGLVNGLSLEQIHVFDNPAFTPNQMRRLRIDIEYGFPLEEVKTYAMPELSVGEMSERNRLLIRQKHPQTVNPDTFLDELGIRFRKDQIKQIRLGALHGLSHEQLMLYADKKWIATQMRQLRLSLENGLTQNQVLFMINQGLSYFQMELVRECFEHNIREERINLFLEIKLDYLQANSVQKAVLAGLPSDIITYYRDLGWEGYQLGVVYYAVMTGASSDDLKLLTFKPLPDEAFMNFNFGTHCPPRKKKLLNKLLPPACEWMFPSRQDIFKQDIE